MKFVKKGIIARSNFRYPLPAGRMNRRRRRANTDGPAVNPVVLQALGKFRHYVSFLLGDPDNLLPVAAVVRMPGMGQNTLELNVLRRLHLPGQMNAFRRDRVYPRAVIAAIHL